VILTGDAFHEPATIPKILDLIEGFATSKIPTNEAHNPLDRDIKPPTPKPQLYDITDLFTSSINHTLHDDRLETQTIQDNNSDSDVNSSNELEFAGTGTEGVAHRVRAVSQGSSDLSMGEDSDRSDVEGQQEEPLDRTRYRPGKKRGPPAVCRGVLWAINTTGCIRGTFLLQFDEPYMDRTKLNIRSKLHYPCCDRHTHISDNTIPVELQMLLPRVRPETQSESNTDGCSLRGKANHTETLMEDSIPAFPVRQGNASWAKKDAIFDVLHTLRETVWRDNAVYGIITPYTASALLPDEVILAIARQCDTIRTTDDIDTVLVHYMQRGSKSHPLPGIDSQRIFETLSPVITSFHTSAKRGVLQKSCSQHDHLSPGTGTQCVDSGKNDTQLETVSAEAPQIY
jgi:hypothetical protein